MPVHEPAKVELALGQGELVRPAHESRRTGDEWRRHELLAWEECTPMEEYGRSWANMAREWVTWGQRSHEAVGDANPTSLAPTTTDSSPRVAGTS